MSLTKTEKIRNWIQTHIKIPYGVKIAICVFPVVITALFYALRSTRGAMDWAVTYISTPVRSFLGLLSSIYPFALMEILCTAAVVFLIYYIVKSIRVTSRRRGRWKLLGKRLLPLLVVVCYIWGLFCWLWNSGYHATGFAERNGFLRKGVTFSELATVTQLFADRANELALLVERDDAGRHIADQRVIFADSTGIYRNISNEFHCLEGRTYAPKSMLFSWLMSITGYSGMYFALTGEAMINTQPPITYIPATIAHEHAHQLGVFAEDEANFVGILACITSDNLLFEYAGYMSGLNYLLNALMYGDGSHSGAPTEEWNKVMSSLNLHVLEDRHARSAFWATRTTANTGIGFLDSFLSGVAEVTSDAVNAVYDGFLRSQNQELGIKSYGACVDLLVEYFIDEASGD